MAASGIRKASMLLMSLDPGTAAKLLKAAGPEVIKQVATELAYLRAAGQHNRSAVDEAVKEFHGMLTAGGAGGVPGDFIQKLLAETVGPEGSKEILDEVDDLVQARDPFLSIRSAAVGLLAEALGREAPQAVAVVLAELPARKSAELLGLLDESVRGEAVMAMAASESASPEARLRIARVVREKLRVLSRSQSPSAGRNQREQKLRKVAVMLRSMAAAARDQLTAAMTADDEATGSAVRRLMVTWEDIPLIADRPLQEALRTTESRKLALALSGAEEAVIAKVRANISERAGAMLDEEASLLSSVKPEEVGAAREEILQTLREMNSKGDLSFQES